MVKGVDAGEVASSYPQTKVTAEDWLELARRILIEDGVEQVRVLPLAQTLGVARSSFYWYFKSRDDILQRLLLAWRTKNTLGIVQRASLPSRSITQAIAAVMECWIDEDLFEPRLDFAIREWARRSPEVMRILRDADEERVAAIEAMYGRHGFTARDARIRASIVYYMQIGYYSVGVTESMQERLAKFDGYVRAFTGQDASAADMQRARRATRRAARSGHR